MLNSNDTQRIVQPNDEEGTSKGKARFNFKLSQDEKLGKEKSLTAAKISIYEAKKEPEGKNENNNFRRVEIRTPTTVDSTKLYDIDLKAGNNNNNNNRDNVIQENGQIKRGERIKNDLEADDSKNKNKPSIFKSVRFYVMIITLISPIVSTYSKNIINFTIIRMIDPEYIKREIRQPENASTPYFDLDNSCPVELQSERGRLLRELGLATHKAQNTYGEKFKWDEQQQGLLKAAYSIGHIPLQIAGSRLSEIYNAHIVLTGSVLITAICSLIAPFMATIHYSLLFIDLFLLGIVGSFITPALITFFSNWLTPGEKSVMLTCYLITSRIGTGLTSIICGSIFKADISWRYIFYSAAGANFFFVIVFFIFATSRPIEHFLISDLELNYLSTKNILVKESVEEAKDRISSTELKTIATIGDNNHVKKTNPIGAMVMKKTILDKKKKVNPPWRAILTSVPVWSFVITKFCVKLSGDLVNIELPAYLDRVMHYEADLNGQINGYGYLIFCIGCFIAGSLSKVAIKRKPFGLEKTTIRKMFQSFASFGVSLLLLGLMFSMCDKTSTNLFLFLWFFVTTFGTGGEQQIPMDLTERYPGTIHAIASSIAISGVIVPIIVGTYLKGHPADQDKWEVIWATASIIATLGGLTFLFGADAKIQSFDSISTNDDNNQTNSKTLEIKKTENGVLDDDENKRKGKYRSDGGKQNMAYERDNLDNVEKPISNNKSVDINYRESRQI